MFLSKCKKLLLLILIPLLLANVPLVQCFSVIAIFPHMGLSHWHFFRPFVSELVRRGHNVTLLSYFGLENPEQLSPTATDHYHEYLFEMDRSEVLTGSFNLEVSY